MTGYGIFFHLQRMLNLRRLSLKGFRLQFSVSLVSSTPTALPVTFRGAPSLERTSRLSLLVPAGSLRLGLRSRRVRKRGFQLLKALL